LCGNIRYCPESSLTPWYVDLRTVEIHGDEQVGGPIASQSCIYTPVVEIFVGRLGINDEGLDEFGY